MNKLIIKTEYSECVALAQYLEILKHQGKILAYTHVPNETFTKSWSAKTKNKMQGVHKGFPDYVIITPKTVLFLEMKRTKGGTTGPEQKGWLKDLDAKQTLSTLCLGFDQAKDYIFKLLTTDNWYEEEITREEG